MRLQSLLFLFAALLLLSCGNSAHLQNIMQMSDDEDPCLRFGCDGTFLAGVKWHDARGENAFIIVDKGVPTEDGEYQTLSAFRFVVLSDNKPKTIWQGAHGAENWCDRGEGVIGKIEVTDLNEDGVGEILYVYNVAGNCDVSPKEYGLVFHTGSQLYEITGSDDLQINRGIPGSGEMTLSESFNSAPEKVRNHAIEVWKRVVPRD